MSVPRLYSRFYDVIKHGLDRTTGMKSKLAKKALSKKLTNVITTGEVHHKIWDKIVFKKTKEALGGRVRWAGTGSAPISADTLSFLKATLCTPIAEGMLFKQVYNIVLKLTNCFFWKSIKKGYG